VGIRAIDEPIPANEQLFRSVSADHVHGEDVLPSAVELPRCSFNREKYCSGPLSVLTERRPQDTGVLAVTPETLPGTVPRIAPSTGSPYAFTAADAPNPPEDPSNSAHAEVRIHPQGVPFSKNHRPNKGVLAKARDELARRLRIVIQPR
jgi:hypothetical protein